MATEKTRLLGKFYNYRSTSFTLDPKSNECIVVLPAERDADYDDSNRLVCLTLEELLPYLDDPWWKALRHYAFISFWILMVAILTAACIISMIELQQQRCNLFLTKVVPTIAMMNSSGNFFPIGKGTL